MTFPKRILLVDHEPRVTRLIRRALEGTGKYVIKSENDYRVALHSARWFRPDVIFVDILASGAAHGDQVAEQFHADALLKDTPIVFVSGADADDEVASRGTFGGYSFVANPVKIPEVLRYVDAMLGEAEAA